MTPEAFQTTYEDNNGTFGTNGTRNITALTVQQFATDIRETFLPREGNGSSLDLSSAFQDDFLMNDNNDPFNSLFITTSGAGAAFDAFSTYGKDDTEHAMGIISISTGTTSTGKTYFNRSITYLKPNIGFKLTATFRMALENLGDGTNRYQVHFGLCDTTSNEPQNGSYFRYADNVNGGRWECVTASGASRTATDSGIDADVLYSIFTIEIAADNSSVLFYINGVLVATNTTTITTSLQNLRHGIIKSVGTSDRLMHCDYHGFVISRISAR
jgi:hypothetical protein